MKESHIAVLDKASCEDARRLFGVDDVGKLDDMLWRFQAMLSVLQDWSARDGSVWTTDARTEA